MQAYVPRAYAGQAVTGLQVQLLGLPHIFCAGLRTRQAKSQLSPLILCYSSLFENRNKHNYLISNINSEGMYFQIVITLGIEPFLYFYLTQLETASLDYLQNCFYPLINTNEFDNECLILTVIKFKLAYYCITKAI